MIFNEHLESLPRPAWGFDEGQCAEALCFISIDMGAWAYHPDCTVAIDDSRSLQSLCRQMAKHFCSLYDPDDPNYWDNKWYVEAIDGYINSVVTKLEMYPNWINSDSCAMHGKETVIDLLAKPVRTKSDVEDEKMEAFIRQLHEYMKREWALDDLPMLEGVVEERWPIKEPVSEFGEWFAEKCDLEPLSLWDRRAR